MTSGEFQDRLRKAKELREAGINPYPSRFESTHSVAQATELGAGTLRSTEEITASEPAAQVTLRGRIMTFREHGRLAFANLKDFTGSIQICFMEDTLGHSASPSTPSSFKLLRKLDMGDFVGCTGELFMTKHGQLTVLIREWTFLGKTLSPLPEKWHGIQDQEVKYRQRYLDLVMNDETMARFLVRTRLIDSIRQYLNTHAFIEVETPILASVASGATARPFSTHHNALDIDVYLRIAPELYLKRLIAGGFERVYEFARCFRNEGMDPSHLQEFTMLEYYGAYWNYEDNMRFTEDMLTHVISQLFGTLKIKLQSRDGQQVTVDFSAPWPRLDFGELILKDSGIDIYAVDENADTLRTQIRAKKIAIEEMDTMGYGNLCDSLYKKVSRPKLIDPCFVINHPASTKPLARRSDANPKVCETFQLLVNTWEVINAYSEIVDPVDQLARFEEQARAKTGGDQDAMEMDTDYVTCMEHGMPPISGWGMGIDRFVTLLTGQDNLRDVVLFPLMRPSAPAAPAPTKLAAKITEPKTKLRYMEDMGQLNFTATVDRVEKQDDKDVVILDETYFYPQGGGQPFDQGTLVTKTATFIVEEVRFIDGEVRHIGHFEKGSFQPGDSVSGEIEPTRRALHSRLHAAGHVVDIALKALKIDWVPGKGYHFPDGPYVEYEGSLEGIDRDALKAELEKICNELVSKSTPTQTVFMPKEEMHTVCFHVPDYLPAGKPARVVLYGTHGIPCGGTHVADLQDIRGITIRKIKQEAGHIRVGYDVTR